MPDTTMSSIRSLGVGCSKFLGKCRNDLGSIACSIHSIDCNQEMDILLPNDICLRADIASSSCGSRRNDECVRCPIPQIIREDIFNRTIPFMQNPGNVKSRVIPGLDILGRIDPHSIATQ